ELAEEWQRREELGERHTRTFVSDPGASKPGVKPKKSCNLRRTHGGKGPVVPVTSKTRRTNVGTIDERRERASAGVALAPERDGWYGDFARPRVFLQPIAAPSVMGLFGFAIATFMVAANIA